MKIVQCFLLCQGRMVHVERLVRFSQLKSQGRMFFFKSFTDEVGFVLVTDLRFSSSTELEPYFKEHTETAFPKGRLSNFARELVL